MGFKTAGRLANLQDGSAFNRLGVAPQSSKTCVFWLQGKCSRNPCRFMHRDSPPKLVYHREAKQSQTLLEDGKISGCNISKNDGSASAEYTSWKTQDRTYLRKIPDRTHRNVWKNDTSASDENVAEKTQQRKSARKIPDYSSNDSMVLITEKSASGENVTPKTQELRICEYWASGNCVHGEKCSFHHSWFLGDDFSIMANLEGHKKAIAGIALPSGSDKLYTGSIDGTARIWDCHSGQCANAADLSADVGSLISEGPWIFVGMPNVVMAWNIQSAAGFHLNGPVGQVYALTVAHDMLFAGAQDGVILAWKDSCSEANPFQPAASLRGHTCSVMCFAVGGKKLYSGSADHSIRVWDLDTFQCTHTLSGHTDVVTSLLCWDQYLLSCSLDKTIKVWAATEGGNVEVTYTHHEDHGVVALCGMNDAEAKPILFCSCNDNAVRLYELPSFSERGRLFSRSQVKVMEVGPGGLFFTGNETGMLTVWKWKWKEAQASGASQVL